MTQPTGHVKTAAFFIWNKKAGLDPNTSTKLELSIEATGGKEQKIMQKNARQKTLDKKGDGKMPGIWIYTDK